MGQITWNTNVNATCCPGEIVNDDGQTILIQTDWSYCGVAQSFGWSIGKVQQIDRDEPCDHSFSDGTVDCPECGITAGEFIAAARDWLNANDGVTTDDPGYFGA